MTIKSKAVASLVLFALLGSGCGTICNLGGGLVDPEKKPTIYGGVQFDLDALDQMAKNPHPLLSTNSGSSNAWGAVFILGFAVTEPVMSFLGDTLTLPITVPLQEMREASEKQKRTDERENAQASEEQMGGPPAINPPAASAPSAVDP